MPVDPREVLVEAREELARADGKASILLAALGVGAGVIAAAILAGDWSPEKLNQPYETLWWAGTASAGAGAMFIGLAVWPRVAIALPSGLGFLVPPLQALHRYVVVGQPSTANYFDEVAILGDPSLVARRLEQTDAAERTMTQLVNVSRIVRLKYRLIRWGMSSVALALVLVLIAVIAGR